MTLPKNPNGQDWQDWEDIVPDDMDASADHTVEANPFAPGRPVDGYELTDNAKYPELRFQTQPQAEAPAPPRPELRQRPAPPVEAPALPRRDPPRRIRDQVPASGVWQPGGSAETKQPQVRLPRPNVATALLFGLIPLGILAGGLYLVMHLYG